MMHLKPITIYGTLGPACRDRETLRAMFREGMDGVRLNLSHTSLEASAALLEAFHEAAQSCGVTPALLIDLQGPELRVGSLEAPLPLHEGARIPADRLPFPQVVAEALAAAAPGQELLLDDGKLLLKREAPEPDGRLWLRVLRGGLLESRKSVALPGCAIRTPALTEADREQLRRAKEFGVTAVMQPFVRGPEDLLEVRAALAAADCPEIRLFAKIENREGIERLEALIPCCDEIVIARGDLGNAMELWELPAVQKRIAAACRRAGRDFMVVTQMLDSMTHRQVPTRAEVSDIFNAVLDGAASVMVTGETAAGEYPALAIRYLARTAREAERYLIGAGT
jgi:pyruvate kinase